MISKTVEDNRTQIVLTPNRSMSWETNKKILAAMFCVNMVIALAWSYMGAWMVLPFAGLEILLVGIGMYYVSWKLNFKQVITIENESFLLQKGVYFPKQEWAWQKSSTRLINIPSNYRMSAPTFCLEHLSNSVEIGDFLNRDEKKALRQYLADLNIPIITRSQSSSE
jgi:uncharacterized membrane protein